MKRVQQEEGQLLLDFTLLIESPPAEPEAPAGVAVCAPTEEAVLPTAPIQRSKQRQKKPEFHAPGVVFVKKGRSIRLKALDYDAADIVHEVRQRLEVPEMRGTDYFIRGPGAPIGVAVEPGEIMTWQEVNSDLPLEEHPIARMIASYGIPVYVESGLRNYLRKERRRQALEQAAYPVPPVKLEVPLFERCSEGLLLRCLKDFSRNGKKLFDKGKRYLVVSTGGEGKDTISLSTIPVVDKAVIAHDPKQRFEWSSFEVAMEGYFDDSEELAPQATVLDLFPERVAYMRKKLDQMNLQIWDHVKEDVVLAALKRGGINAYLMRMGKTSWALTLAKLKEKKKVAMIGPRNARIFTVRELKRLGYHDYRELNEEQKQDPKVLANSYIIVESLADLEAPVWMWLITYTWLARGGPRQSMKGFDPTSKPRDQWTNYLKPSREIHVTKAYGTTSTNLFNDCPHCHEHLQRPVWKNEYFHDGQWVLVEELPEDVPALKSGLRPRLTWTTDRGYLCRNEKCRWTTDNRGKIGAAWNETRATRVVRHRARSYIDLTLARHAFCPDEKLRTRQCPECKATDGVWTPPLYKRCSEKFTMVIGDEIHNCAKAPTKTDISRAIYSLHTESPWGLTGTLMSNDATDTYWPLHYTQRPPSAAFPYLRQAGASQFEKRFCDHMVLEKPIGEEIDPVTGQAKTVTKLVSRRIPFLKNPPDWWRFMESKVIRRTYEDQLFQATLLANNFFMPTPDIERVPCPMDPEQAKLMLMAIKDFRGQFQKMVEDAKTKGAELNSAIVISQMSTLRTLATCPEKLNRVAGKTVYTGAAGGGKRGILQLLVKQHTENDGKVVVLSDFLDMQRTATELLRPFNPIRFQTDWDEDARREAFEQFHTDAEHRVIVAGTRAIREGSDLSRADVCICCDMLWAPGLQAQAWSRILTATTRQRNCKVYLLVSEHSLDEHIYTVFYGKLQAAKQAMDRKIMNRRVQEFDVKFFVERVLKEETEIASYLRESEGDTLIMPDLDISELEEREV